MPFDFRCPAPAGLHAPHAAYAPGRLAAPARSAKASRRGSRSRWLGALALTVWLCPACAQSAPTGGGAAAAAHYRVEIEAPPALRTELRRSLDIERWTHFAGLREQQLRSLLQAAPAQARRVLEALGYFTPRIAVHLDRGARPQRVVLRVDPGQPTRVASVRLQVRGPGQREAARLQACLLRNWELGVGKVFASSSWRSAKGSALLLLSTRRYAAARIAQSRALVDPAAHRARLYLQLDTGPAYRFGALAVQGLRRYPASVVGNLLPWKRGDPYSQRKLLQLQARLQDTHYFRRATVAAPLAAAQGDELPVRVSVVEQRARRLGAGLGYSSNTGARTQLDYTDLNWLGKAWRLRGQIQAETLQQSLQASLALPRRADGVRYRVVSQLQHADIQGLVTRSQTLGLQRRYERSATATVESLQFINEQQQIAGAGTSSGMALMPGWSWTRSSLDNRLDPRSGGLLKLQVAAAARGLLSDQDFVRLDLHGLRVVPLGRREQLLLRAQIGEVLSPSASGIPQQVLFRAGGVGSVRGYAYQSLGVRAGGAVVGGRALLTASVEGVRWVLPRWGLALFADAGNAADNWAALHPVLGWGIGVRWRSPAGLLSVDLAHGQASGATRLEFNVGIGF